MDNLQQQVVDAIVLWALQLSKPLGRSRVNLKLLFGDTAIAQAVREALLARSDARCAYVVRRSADSDAVRLRNERPAGVGPETGILYLVFWLPGQPGHERNFESLRDFRSVTLADFLTGTASFVLPQEVAIEEQCIAASQSWPTDQRKRAETHLLAAFRALRQCLRERRGGRDRSISFVERLDNYLDCLNSARVVEDLWSRTPANERPRVLVESWGEALSKLSMFCLPALASVIGIHVDTSKPVPSGKDAPEARWPDYLEQILAENKEIATDFAGLGESIAGHQTVRERLDSLTAKIPLCQPEAQRLAARMALERFCHSGDDSALRQVEWLFLQNPVDRRSASFGLKGLLIARKLREPRENPLDRAARETIALLESVAGDEARQSGVIKQYVEDQKNRATLNRRDAVAVADFLSAIAVGVVSPSIVPPGMASAVDHILASPERNALDFERLARVWQKLGRPDADAPINADTLLLGLVQLSYARLREQEPTGERYAMVPSGEQPGQLKLTATVEGERTSFTVDAADWSSQSRTDIHQWLLQKVRPLYFDAADPALDGAQDDEPMAITLDAEWQRGAVTTALGVVEIPIRNRPTELLMRSRSTTLASVKCDGSVEAARLLGELFETNDATTFAEDPRDDKLSAAWADYVRALGDDPGWNAIATVGPLPKAAEAWVNAWSQAVSQVGTHGQIAQELKAINETIRQDLQSGGTRLAELFHRQQELQNAQQGGPAVDIQTVRSILRLCTGRTELAGRVQRLVLTPHHPLVLRLRMVGDEILATTLRQLWTIGWDRRTLDDLDGALDEWGLPEPIHSYGFWDGEPLTFDAWTQDYFATFSPLGVGRESDAEELGARQVARELARYSDLFPAAADRLRMRVRADPRGEWAWRLLSDRLDSPGFAADVELLTDLPPRQLSAIDEHARADELRGHAFEPGSDGELPRVRVMRRGSAPTSEVNDVHVSAVVGDLVEELRPTMSPMVRDSDRQSYGMFDPRVFFQEPVPELLEFSFLVGDAPDDLSEAVATAVGIAAGHPNLVFRERYSFDPTRCRYPLEQLQRNAHWLILASRQSLYRAVQQCGTSTLLDFYSVTERRRPVHVCVSLDRRNAQEDVKRLRLLLESLVGGEVDEAKTESLLSAARALAPGLAIRCIGSTGGIDLSGLVGLLLSARSVEAERLGGLLLSLDQHRDLLAGGGQLSDLLRLRLKANTVSVDVIEAKFSTAALSSQSGAVAEAQHQVRSTIERLAQFSLDHPLILRTRSRLARAIIHRIHLGAGEQGVAGEWKALLEAVLDPKVQIVVAHGASAIHAWSVEPTTQDSSTVLPTGEALYIHGRDDTLQRLRALR